MHHPFTSPREEDLDKIESDPSACKARAYDLVLNGSELGGGSIRIHRPDIQQRVFSTLGITPEKARARFGFLLDALESGAPPHGGIAIGWDRTIALMCGETNIREVIAFPKTASAVDLMSDAPSTVDPDQLKELELEIKTAENLAAVQARQRRAGESDKLLATVINISKMGLLAAARRARDVRVYLRVSVVSRDECLGDSERPHAGHLYRPDLDVDLAEESIDHPERYPLISRRE
jgi:hypothetical protein